MKSTNKWSSFQLMEQLGQGGTAKVIKVFAQNFHRLAALKYPLDTNEQNGVNFSHLAEREKKLIGNVKYPGIVKIIDSSTENPQYLLLELCSGPTLEKIGKIKNINVALNILSAIAINLEFLQTNSIIHGDLKPDNIFLPSNWESLNNNQLFYVKFSDFSLGRFISEPEALRVGLGTVGYMAPETIIDSQTSFSSDIFAFGIIAYQILTGHHPFMTDITDPVKINSRIREETPQPIEQLRPDLNNKLIELINQIISKDPSSRPKSGWEICQSLKQAGATYPFEKALRPKHFLVDNLTYDDYVNIFLNLNDKQMETLRLFTNEEVVSLRCLLTMNFIRNNLKYDNHQFTFINNIYLAHRLRNKAVKEFCKSSFKQKKLIIKTAISGNRENALKLLLIRKDSLINFPPLLFEIILPLLRTHTVKKLSLPMAKKAEKNEYYNIAANLFIQAGKLNDAERCAYQAAILFKKENKNDQALSLLKKVIRYGKLKNDEYVIRQLLMLQGDIYKERGETDKALTAYQNIIKIYYNIPPDKLLAETYKKLGDVYKTKQKFEEGIEALNKALNIYKDLNEELEISRTYNNIGNIYWIASNFGESLKYYRIALKIQKRLKVIEDLSTTLNNIGVTYGIIGRYQRSISLFKLSLEFKKKIGNIGEIARALNNLGLCYRLIGENNKAVSYLKQSLESNRKIGNKKEILFNLENLTTIMIIAGQLKQSINYLKEGIALAEEIEDLPHYAILNVRIGVVQTRLGHFTNALKCFKTANNIVQQIDDKFIEISIIIESGNCYYLMDSRQKALNLAMEALNQAEMISNKNSVLEALILITKISDDQQYFDKGLKLAEELKIKRVKYILNFNHLEHNINKNDLNKSKDIFKEAITYLNNVTDDIELPRFYDIIAEYYIQLNEINNAITYLNKALKKAQGSGLTPELIKTFTLLGQIKFDQKEFEESYNYYKNAIQVAKKISDNIDSTENRKSFRNQEIIKFLEKEIKRLSVLIGQKNRAGLDPALQKQVFV